MTNKNNKNVKIVTLSLGYGDCCKAGPLKSKPLPVIPVHSQGLKSLWPLS